MKIEFDESFEPTSRADISELEQELKISLPDSYKVFLLDCNGGYTPLRSEFNAGGDTFVVDAFFGIGLVDDNYIYDLKRNIVLNEGDYPEQYISFALDVFGNVLLLDSQGAIYLWKHDQDAVNTDTAIIHVAENLESFLMMLKH